MKQFIMHNNSVLLLLRSKLVRVARIRSRLIRINGIRARSFVRDIQVGVQWVAFQLAVQGRGEVAPGPLQGRHQAGMEAAAGRGMPLW